MARSIIDPITRIEGHMRVEMEVENGTVKQAWCSGGSFRGMEKVVEHRKPEDAAQIVQRICGVCPVSHSHSSTIAAEKAYGIKIPNRARIIRNLIEGAQFLHSHILWLYNLAALDYVNPIDAVTGGADVKLAYDIAQGGEVPQLGAALPAQLSTSSDLYEVQKRLEKFAANGQLSIFSGNWFDAKDPDGSSAYHLTPELDLLLTSHYLEALKYQARSSEICGLLGGKMPHVMTIVPGGTSFVPTAEKLDDLWSLVNEVRDWVLDTMLPDTKIIAAAYPEALGFGKGCGRYVAWGVFEGPEWPYDEDYTKQMNNRYLPAGVVDENLGISDVNEDLITEYIGSSWYVQDEATMNLNPREGVTDPEYVPYYKEGTEFEEGGHTYGEVNDRYTWSKGPAYDGKPHEAGPFSRVLAAYLRGVDGIKKPLDDLCAELNLTIPQLQSTLGRVAARQVEAVYIANLMVDWVAELIEAIKGGDAEYFREPKTITGEGTGFWEAPRGALYHTEHVENGKITGYQIIIPTTWNIAPRNADGVLGPMEQALVGCPVDDVEMPINALRTVHSFDPCTACAVHVTEPSTGKHFETVTSPWGVK